MEGYSGTSLAKKLGIKEGFNILIVNQPTHYFSLFSELPDGLIEQPKPLKGSVDFIHVFFKTEDDLYNLIPGLKSLLKKNGMLWVSWPKGKSKIKTNINREAVRDFMLSKIKLVDIKVAAIDADWSALKFVYRTIDRH